MELDETNTEPGPADAGETRAEAVPTTTQEARPPARDGEAEVATPAPAAVAVPADKPRRAPARTVAHLTPAERVARGKAARTGVSRRSHGEWEPSPDAPRSDRAARGPGADTRPGARADPLRADADLPVRVLPGGGVHHGGRSRSRTALRAARAAVRRRAPLELRWLRGAGSPDRVQPQRLRRDATGAVRVGRQATGRELRRGGPGAGVRRGGTSGSGRGRRSLVPHRNAGVRPEGRHGHLVRASRDHHDHRPVGTRGRARSASRSSGGTSPEPGPRTA